MGTVAIKIKIMPESPDTNLKEIEEKASEKLRELGGIINKVEEEPIAFGLNAIHITIARDEEKDTEILETELEKIEGVSSAKIVDYRRAIG
ncbi:elongation factor 1-beta [Candidatus Pacearchaeota archaeon]|nr:elongation factor 1-beta [Candidatus Pacearchaeota archaeon]